jgi:hypothetical protein
MDTEHTPHHWSFFRAGGLDQVRIETGADVAHLEQLDQKLWVALACPVRGLELDEKTLAVIDADHDGRVRAPEVLAAVQFCRDALVDLDGLVVGSDAVALDAIRDDTEAGKAIGATARRILEALGRPEATTICLADCENTVEIFARSRFNGDGVITADATDDPDLKQVIADIIAIVGSEVDRSGGSGISQSSIDAFFDQIATYDAWFRKAEDPAAGILPLGEKTEAAASAVGAVEPKVDDYFTRCRLAAFESRAEAVLNRTEAEYASIAAKDLSASAVELASFPIARIEAGRPLPLVEGLNPAWRNAMARFRTDAVIPLVGDRTSLTEGDWDSIRGSLADHRVWTAEQPSGRAPALGIARVRALLSSTARADLGELVAHDKSLEAEFDGIVAVEKLVRLHRDLFRLLHNYVAFTDFYAPDELAAFQAGTLYIDSRSCNLCIRVEDAGRHAAMAGLARCYLAYCDCTRSGEKMQIAAVFSGGDRDYLMVGRNGIFYDRKGRDWDATISRVIENPISLREAFYSPYKKFVRMIEEQVTRRAAAAEAASSGRLTAAASSTANLDKAVAAPPKAPGIDLSTIALIGVAVSGAAAVAGAVLQAFFGLGVWMPIGLLAIVLGISGPSMLIAALKLRQRNMGPVLDANGWAINGRVKVNIPFGGSLTKMQRFPEGSSRSLIDPYQVKKSPWIAISYAALVVAFLVVATILFYHEGWLPSRVESHLAFYGVPKHLRTEKDVAGKAVDDARVVLASAQEQRTAASKAVDEARAAQAAAPPVAMGSAEDPAASEKASEKTKADAKLERAMARLERSDAKVQRAEDKLDTYERRLERATEALDSAVNADEARKEAAEAAEAAKAGEHPSGT